MPNDDSDRLDNLRDALLDHPLYTEVVSVADLRRFMEDHVFAVWDFMSLLKRLQQDMTCTRVPWFPAQDARAARLINDIVIGEETDVDPDGSYASHLDLYLRAMRDIGASTDQFDTFCSMVQAGIPVEVVLTRIGGPPHVRTFVAHTMSLANAATTEEVLAAFFYGREDIIPEMFSRLLKTLYSAKHDNHSLRHFIYYIDRHIELDGDSHGPKGRELLEDLVGRSPDRAERAMRAACSSIKARIDLWNGTLSKVRSNARLPVEAQA
jgi:FAD/FMN-containing dehydrogenase